MSKTDFDKLPITRQGVRNLNNVGAPVRQALRRRRTCPPHLPGDWETDKYGFTRILRCRLCRAVLDQLPDAGW